MAYYVIYMLSSFRSRS